MLDSFVINQKKKKKKEEAWFSGISRDYQGGCLLWLFYLIGCF